MTKTIKNKPPRKMTAQQQKDLATLTSAAIQGFAQQRDKMVSYAHRDDPKGTRFQQMAADAVPAWAVDIIFYDGPLNARGQVPHVTDRFVHYKDKDNVSKELREAYDHLVKPGDKVAEAFLERLLEAAYSAGGCDEAESRDGE